jgi:hypothetical protein
MSDNLQWLGSNTRRTLFRVHPRGATCLGIVATDGNGWTATAYGRDLGKRPTREEAGALLCERVGVAMFPFEPDTDGDDL